MNFYFKNLAIFLIFLKGMQGLSIERSLEVSFENEISDLVENGKLGPVLTKTFKDLDLKNELFAKTYARKWTKEESFLFCFTCRTAMDKLIKIDDVDKLKRTLKLFCLKLDLGNEEVCDGLIQSNADDEWFIIKHTPGVTGKDVCGMLFAGKGCETDNPKRNFEVSLPDSPKPTNDEPPFSKRPKTSMKILHLADTHYDPYYIVGAPAVCEQKYLCCRQNSTTSKVQGTVYAGKWGSYGYCDVPKSTIEDIYAHISKTHQDIDLIIWTGDIVPHNVWEVTKEQCVFEIKEMADLVSKYFPNVPVYPAVGNHESSPVNLFPQPYISKYNISWLYDELASVWSRWLPLEVARNASFGAFYSTRIKPGLKLISLNTNYCYTLNWWLILDSLDVAGELLQLANELQRCEDEGDKVYIIGHIPPGESDCHPIWSHQFNKIIARYEDTVTGLFYGHTHNDHFEIFFHPNEPSRPYEVAYIAQSQTTYVGSNSGYKIYTTEGDYEGSYYRVLDHENWILNLELSNRYDEPQFMKTYSAKDEYEMEDLSPASWYDLVLRMNSKNTPLFDTFYRNHVKDSPSLVSKGCNKKCKKELLCGLLTSDSSDKSACEINI